ncbi:NADP-dependent 3-hydroxy acid dehydrogenase YdfG [Bradyrhizobium japonicum]|nr:SDR family oxidoreductase [Bradyrhizobium liaoningense]MCP1746934.1 NADP-dependent 3-hydroxy acid dehydrogenase YdfG [Bradyrhizobium japonicum]MBR1000388.1 SDR family oxidoreductase [Bradyrhizobium liaoningense]MBR1066357.1 SDR family oxidoreductase [Bradyrhizobium liaoningense]MCP1774577.1 NADP-dependent 3-hydroxy acid dehydrogenase YdfG [Bradyrhizobium japonicum]
MTKNGKRVAWVTGGGSGIGEAGAEALAADGWIVVVSGRRRDALDTVVARIAKAGGAAEAIALDVSNAAEAQKAADQIVAKHGRIDLLVNNAGINVPKRSWKDMELEGWDKLVQVNLNGVLYCMRAVLPTMRKQQDGSIINVSSWAGRHVSKMPGPAYTTTKHAVLALTHSFNMDECVNGLRACCLMPGEVATPILKLRPVVPSEAEQAKMLQSEDLGRTIAFIASMPPRVCINELLISPTHNRGFISDAEQQGLRRAHCRRVGKGAKRRAHHLPSIANEVGGHASLCPPYGTGC